MTGIDREQLQRKTMFVASDQFVVSVEFLDDDGIVLDPVIKDRDRSEMRLATAEQQLIEKATFHLLFRSRHLEERDRGTRRLIADARDLLVRPWRSIGTDVRAQQRHEERQRDHRHAEHRQRIAQHAAPGQLAQAQAPFIGLHRILRPFQIGRTKIETIAMIGE